MVHLEIDFTAHLHFPAVVGGVTKGRARREGDACSVGKSVDCRLCISAIDGAAGKQSAFCEQHHDERNDDGCCHSYAEEYCPLRQKPALGAMARSPVEGSKGFSSVESPALIMA